MERAELCLKVYEFICLWLGQNSYSCLECSELISWAESGSEASPFGFDLPEMRDSQQGRLILNCHAMVLNDSNPRGADRQTDSRSAASLSVVPEPSPLWGTGTQVLLRWWWRSAALHIWIIGASSVRPGANGIIFEWCCSLQRCQLSFISSFRLTVMIELILRNALKHTQHVGHIWSVLKYRQGDWKHSC